MLKSPSIFSSYTSTGNIVPHVVPENFLWQENEIRVFGSKPMMVIKGGSIAYAQMGDPNASIPTTEPRFMRPMFGALSALAVASNSISFMSQASIDAGMPSIYGLKKRCEGVKRCSGLGKADMKLNDKMPEVKVDPETYLVTADGYPLKCKPADELPCAQTFFMF